MPRKAQENFFSQADWYLSEWMDALRVSQADLARATDMTKTQVHNIYHGKTRYYREIVNIIAEALNIEPFELLLPPGRAMEIRSYQQAVQLAADRRLGYRAGPAENGDLPKLS